MYPHSQINQIRNPLKRTHLEVTQSTINDHKQPPNQIRKKKVTMDEETELGTMGWRNLGSKEDQQEL